MNGPNDEAFVVNRSTPDPRRAGESWPEYRSRTGSTAGSCPPTITNKDYADTVSRCETYLHPKVLKVHELAVTLPELGSALLEGYILGGITEDPDWYVVGDLAMWGSTSIDDIREHVAFSSGGSERDHRFVLTLEKSPREGHPDVVCFYSSHRTHDLYSDFLRARGVLAR